MAKGKDYEVGYGKPPPEHRFRKGQSGNPRGRRSAKLNEAELVAKVRDELITMTINGKTRRITAFEAAIRKTHMTVLAKGNVRDLEKLFQLYARYGAEPEELRNAQAKEAADKVIGTIMDIFHKTRESRRHDIVTERDGASDGTSDDQFRIRRSQLNFAMPEATSDRLRHFPPRSFEARHPH